MHDKGKCKRRTQGQGACPHVEIDFIFYTLYRDTNKFYAAPHEKQYAYKVWEEPGFYVSTGKELQRKL